MLQYQYDLTFTAWSIWSGWSYCTYTCGGGLRRRSRTCRGGTDCIGDKQTTEGCNKQPCPC